MVLGEWKTVSGRFGEEDTVVPYENADLAELLEEAISNIHAEITDYEVDEELTEEDNLQTLSLDEMTRVKSVTPKSKTRDVVAVYYAYGEIDNGSSYDEGINSEK